MSRLICVVKKNKIEDLKKVCEDIRKKDKGFDYLIEERKFATFLIINCADEKDCWKKGAWFFHKTNLIKYYWVEPD